MPGDDFIRAFIALNLPDDLRANLARLHRSLRRALPGDGVRWTPPGQIHLTLKFLGDVPGAEVDDLIAAFTRGCRGWGPFALQARGLGVFPDARRPRVLWAGVAGGLDALRQLQEGIEAETGRWREREARPFQPHLTLARFKVLPPGRALALGRKLATPAADYGPWRVAQVDLMRSHLSATGVTHERLAGCALA
jgi:RNA 2',3'-cyclic 3'-phosphodiesterase